MWVCEDAGNYKVKSTVKNYKDMLVWQKGVEIADATYSLTKNFPTDERFGLSQQMHRSAVSVPSNIAEGFCRQHTKEYVQFCHIALGSCAELETQLLIAKRRGFVEEDKFVFLQDLIDHESKMLMNLIRSLQD